MNWQTFKLPRWNELPNLDLYLDQVVGLVNSYLAELMPVDQKKVLTTSMLNNYVKQALIPAPIKKKYSRQHLVFLILISLMKQIFTLTQSKAVLDLALQESSLKDFYDDFCEQQEMALQFVSEPQNKAIDIDNQQTNQMVTLAIATSLASKQLIAEKMPASTQTTH